MIKLFVYGILKDTTPGKKAWVIAKCYDLGAYPAITELGEGWLVEGKIIEVDQDTLNYFDQIEGYPDLYHRQLVEINGEHCQVYVFTHPEDIKDRVPCINFKRKGIV